VLKYVLFIGKICLSVGLVWFAFSRIDVETAWKSLKGISTSALIIAFALLSGQMLLAAARLYEFLAHQEQPYRVSSALRTVLVGAFFSQTFISFLGGDVVRILRLIGEGVPRGKAAKAVILDRLAGFAGLVVIVIATLPFLVPMLDSIEMLIGVLLIGTGAIGGVATAFILRRLPAGFLRWTALREIAHVANLGVEVAREGRRTAIVIGASLAIQLLNILTLFSILRGLAVQIELWNCFVLLPTVLFLSMLPISVAGWGVREGAMIAALSLVGVPGHASLAVSICYGLCLVVVSLPGALVWFSSRTRWPQRPQLNP
jgi:uncharacterized membrane protein YbhN (UPF0104 family)